MQHRNKHKFELYFFSIIVIALLVFYVIRQRQLQRIEKDGVYVLGYVTETNVSKNGIGYHCYYKYKGIRYTTTFTDLNPRLKKGSLLFLKFRHPGHLII